MEFLENIQKLLNRKKHSTHQQKKEEKNSISGLDLFLCSPDKTPSYKMCFIYQLIFDVSKKSGL